MKTPIIKRTLLGFPLGLAWSQVITIVISLFIGDGGYYPFVPSLKETMGSDMGAILLQALLSGLMGSGFACMSFVWERDDWSMMKQCGIYFFAMAAFMLPVAYFTHWMERSLLGVATYYGLFTAIFLIIYGAQYLLWRQKIKKLNRTLK